MSTTTKRKQPKATPSDQRLVKMHRSDKLLMDVADQFENASAIMHHDWLVENNVLSDECFNVSHRAAMAIRGFLKAPKHIQTAIIACSAADDSAMAEAMVAVIERKRLMGQLSS